MIVIKNSHVMYDEGFESDLGFLKCTVEYPPSP
jgi:hypothetical protein